MPPIFKKIPEYLPDLQQNFAELVVNNACGELTKEQLYAICLAVSYSIKNEILINAFNNEAKMVLDAANILAIRAATIMVKRNNVFYKIVTGSSDPELQKQTINLFESAISAPNMDQITFKMAMLSVSMVNNCNRCVDFYTAWLIKRGVGYQAITSVARLVAVLSSVSDALEIDALRSYDYGAW